MTLTLSLIFPQETMNAGGKPGNHGISNYNMENISVELRRDIDNKTGNFQEITAVGAFPRGLYQGRQPKVIRLSITFPKSSKDLRAFAKTLNRTVPCVNNIFMPKMVVTVTESIYDNIIVGSQWYVDVFATSRTNNRGNKFDAELTLLEYIPLDGV